MTYVTEQFPIFTIHCSRIYDDTSYNDATAERLCEVQGAHLVSIHSTSELQFVTSRLTELKQYWMKDIQLPPMPSGQGGKYKLLLSM